MGLLFFLFINSILFCISKNIDEKFLNTRKIEKSGTSSWLIQDFEIQSYKSEVPIDTKIRTLQTETQSNKINDTIVEQVETTPSEIINDIWNLSESENPSTTPSDQAIYIFPLLLLGFDHYNYSNNSIQFFTHLRIINISDIYYISFPISINSYGRLRNLEEEIIYVTCNKSLEFQYDESSYYFNCVKRYNKTPSSVKFLNYKDFFIDELKANKLILTSYAKYLGSNIQEQTRNNSYLKPEILFFNNSTIINLNKNITIKGEYYHHQFSKNAYLLINKENETDFPCIMKKNEEENDTYLICKPLTSFEGNLNFVAVNLSDINKIMYLNFSENNPYVNFIISNSKRLSIGVIVAIVSICIIFLSFVGLFIYFIKIKNLHPTPSIKYINKSRKNNRKVNSSSFTMNRK